MIAGSFLFFWKKTSPTISYELEGRTYTLLVANNSTQWEKGLMNINKLDNADGMIFIFPDSEYRSFWNKDTHLDLDIYWLDGDKVAGKSFLPSIDKSGSVFMVKSPKAVNKVIEIVSSR